MTYYIAQRLALLPFLLMVYSFVIFAIIQAPPGDFLTSYVATLLASGTSISAEQVQALRHDYGLDQSFIVQYLRWPAESALREARSVARISASQQRADW
jgi:peptide/nickel transport system permease protein